MKRKPITAPRAISIILCTRGRCAELKNTLASLSRVHIPSQLRAELLVVESGAKEDVEALTTSFRHHEIEARYLSEPVPGKSRALNLAITQAEGELLLFTDDDVRFPADWVTRMQNALIESGADALAGGVKLAPHLIKPWMNHIHRGWLASTADYLSADNPAELCGANMAIKRKVFDLIGGFDTELGPGVTGGGEESLLSQQIKQAGMRIAGALDIEIEHHANPERLRPESWFKAAEQRGQTRAYLLHHWLHERIRFPLLLSSYYTLKLWIRKTIDAIRKVDADRVSAWELGYRSKISECSHYITESSRPRNYPCRSLRKQPLQEQAVTV